MYFSSHGKGLCRVIPPIYESQFSVLFFFNIPMMFSLICLKLTLNGSKYKVGEKTFLI